jgi:predicted AAA+ superfamily ATPase
MFDRALASRVRQSSRNLLLLGPRQVGKSTLLRALHPDLVLDLASPSVFRDYVTHPERLELELRAAPDSLRLVLLDEVQRVPRLLDVVQVLHDAAPRRFRFLLSGSSARQLRRGQANLLPGRVQVQHLHPLLAKELGSAFDLDRALAHGTLPGIWSEADPALRAADLRSYVDTYLREEVQAEALVRDIGGYTRLLELVAAASGRILNLAALGDDAGVAYETARRYLSVLEDTLLIHVVPAWSGSDRGRLVAHPRIFLFDSGVRNALLRRPLDRPAQDERGLLLEHFVAHEILRRIPDLWAEARLSHFRSSGGAEVDFVLEIGSEIWGIEVKASRSIRAGAIRGFDALADHAPRLRRRILVFLGPRKALVGKAEALPVEDFLRELPG